MQELLEHRFIAGIEWRATPDGVVVEGVAVPYRTPTDIGGLFTERIEAGSFGDVAAADVIANVQHRRDRPLARTGPSGGLVLSDGPESLRARLVLPDTTEGRDCAVLVRQGVLRGFSIEFSVRDGGETWTDTVRSISAAELRGLALVDRPAYSDAEIAIRAKTVKRGKTAKSLEGVPDRRRRAWL